MNEEGQILLRRDKSLRKMSPIELVSWLGRLCKLWTFERHALSLGLPEIEEEMIRTMRELIRFFEVEEATDEESD